MPHGPGSRRARLLGLATFLVIVILYLSYRPLAAPEIGYPGSGLASNLDRPDGASDSVAPQVPDDKPDYDSNYELNHEFHHEPEPELQPEPEPEPEVEPKLEPDFDPEVDPVLEPERAEDVRLEDTPSPPPRLTSPSMPAPASTPMCKQFEEYQRRKPGPSSQGKRRFPYVRPPPECRTFYLPEMEALIARMKTVIADPDLFRLFENSYPNTLDTMVKWRGYAERPVAGVERGGGESLMESTDEELAYIITGDIDAMWLRDSASQIMSYLPLLTPSADPNSLASLWRGVINAHARYIVISPYCHSFQPPPESGIPPTNNSAYKQNHPNPRYDPKKVFDCKWELDSLASFLQLSAAYYARTGDAAFFGRYSWLDAVRAAVAAAKAMQRGTYDADGRVLQSAWTFTGWTDRGTETLTNNGMGNPVRQNGMVRSAFRPSDDATIFQLLVPANMMFAAYLEQASLIAEALAASGADDADVDADADADGDGDDFDVSPFGKRAPALAPTQADVAANLTRDMRDLATDIRLGIDADAIVYHREFGDVFAYEVDGYGGTNLMDDANVPSLLAMPLWNYTRAGAGTTDEDGAPGAAGAGTGQDGSETRDYAQVYRNTRAFALGPANPYFAKGPVLSAVGGPHLGPGKGWPMAAVVAALTALDPLSGIATAARRQHAVAEQLHMLLDSTTGTGVMHESVNAWNDHDFTRPWFGWANGLFGELVLRIMEEEERQGLLGDKRGLLGRSWQ